ncbi:MAG: hypothetical protein LCH95_00385 [Proteobacteria bacterium]|nr:hypothetical protein [Pseudomonadota bacterium]
MRRLLLLAGLAAMAGPAFGQGGNPLGMYVLGGSGGGSGMGGGDSLDGNAAFRSWIDQPKSVTASDGTSGTMRFNADGTATRTDNAGVVDGGTWRHHELGFCSTWAKDAAGKERCYSIGTGNGQTYITLQGANGPAYYVKP